MTVLRALTAARRGVRRPAALIGALALGIAALSSACTLGRHAAAGCPPLTLRIAATPQIAPAIERIAARYNASHPKPGGDCVRVDIQQVQPSEVASSLSGQGMVTASVIPDAWIPDSTLWIDRARDTATGAGRVAAVGPSLAISPVVLALPQPVALKLARSRVVPSWKMLLPNSLPSPATGGAGVPGSGTAAVAGGAPVAGAVGGQPGPPFRLKILDPVSNAAGLATLLAMRTMVGHGQAGLINFVTVARVAQFLTVPDDSSLFRAMFATSRPTAGLTTEQAVWEHNRAQPTRPAVAVYLAEGSPVLDFPYVPTTADLAKRRAIAAFGRELVGRSGQQVIRAQGLRTPDGTAEPAFGRGSGVRQPPPPPIPLPSARVATAVHEMWGRILIGARMLIALDVSPSMGALVPGTGVTRLDAVSQLTEQGLGLFDKSDVIGLWTFDTGLADPDNYRVMVPMRPLNERVPVGTTGAGGTGPVAGGGAATGTGGTATVTQLDLLLGALAVQKPEIDTITALYETIRSAFAEVSRGYTPDRFNGVVVLTDGTNYDPRPNALTLRKLVSILRREFNPQRPVNVLIVGYGHSVDFGAMRAIAGATEGAVYEADSPAGIEKFYLQMLTRLVCNRNCPVP